MGYQGQTLKAEYTILSNLLRPVKQHKVSQITKDLANEPANLIALEFA